MVFRSKIDSSFTKVTIMTITVLAGIFLLSLLLSEMAKMDVIINLALFVLSSGFLLWISFSIRYRFEAGCLLIKSGPIRKRIPYDSMIRIVPTIEIWSGFRILSSKDSYELFYNSGSLGSLKISPKDSSRFIDELKNR